MHTRTPTAIVLVTVLSLARATPATSEPAEGNGQAAHALAQVQSGARVRIERDGGRVLEGRYVTVTDDGDVVLAEPAARIPAASIHKVWLRGRAVTTGAIVGGIVLGAATALAGAAAGAYCESDCGDGVIYEYGAIGFVIGAGVGALTGGLAGAAIPKWHRLDLGASTPTRTARGPATGGIGSFSLLGGRTMGRGRNSANGGFGARLGLSGPLPGGFAPGLEFGRFGLHSGESVRHVGFSLTKTRDHGRLRPYGLASVGRYSWHGFNSFAPDAEFARPEFHRSFLGASVGGGAHWRARRNLSLDVEGRWHTSLHQAARPPLDGRPGHWNMASLTTGARFLW